jgi:hypothetical protein
MSFSSKEDKGSSSKDKCQTLTDTVLAVRRQNAEHHDVHALTTTAIGLKTAANGANHHIVVANWTRETNIKSRDRLK